MNSAIVQLAIGILFVFILVGSAASFLNELVAALLNRRAVHLERWLTKALGADAGKFFDHPLIGQLRGTRLDLRKDRRRPPPDAPPATGEPEATAPTTTSPPAPPLIREQRPPGIWRFRYASVPSYLSTTTFATALLSILGKTDQDQGHPTPVGGVDLRAAIDRLDDPRLQALLRTLLADAGDDLARFRHRLEVWFAEEMDRLSGWYKRRTKWFLLLWGLVIASLLNVDAVVITRALWTDHALRSAIVAQAATATPSCPPGATGGQAGAPGSTAGSDPFDCLAARIEELQGLNLPVGWPGSPFTAAVREGGDPRAPHGGGDWSLKLLGLTIMGLAAMQGGPFWFDLLGKLVNLRLTGPKPEQPPLTEGAGPDPPARGSPGAAGRGGRRSG